MLNTLDLKVTEIFRSIQGESTFQGQPCTFIRLTGCNLACSYCDTAYAKAGGDEHSIDQILAKVKQLSLGGLVEITGGEPLMQKNVPALAQALMDDGYKVLVETNGSIDISKLASEVVKVMDIKCPSSGESEKTRWSNLKKLETKDQIKFVLSDEKDYSWAKKIIEENNLQDKSPVLLSTVWDKLSLSQLSEWVLRDNLNVIVHPQLHKIIWGSDTWK